MATEELIILLDARTAKLDAKLKATNNRLDGLSNKTSKGDSKLKKFGGAATAAAGAALKLATAALAVSAALTAMTLSAASNRRNLELLAKQAKTSTQDFQALAFATSKYGTDAEKIGDISKEISLKISEFATAGTGAFQDYADVMRLSKDEARDAAREFEGLSSQEILGTMIARMEDAGASAGKMEFAIDSLASDAERIIPLFTNNSEELLTLKKRFDDVNSAIQITGTQAEALREVSTTYTLMTASIGNATTAISATLAPVMDSFFNDVIEIVPTATQTIIDFMNSFLDAENITSIAGVNKEIADGQQRIDELTEKINGKRVRGINLVKESRNIEQTRLDKLKLQLEVLQAQEQSIEDAKRLTGGTIDANGEGSAFGDGTGEEVQAIADRFKLEEQLLAEKLMRELEMIGENDELKLQLYQEFADNLQEIKDGVRQDEWDKEDAEFERFENKLDEQLKLESETAKANEKAIKEEKKDEQDKYLYKVDQVQGFAQAASIINSSMLGDNEILAKGLIVADTAAAVMKSLSINPYDYANVAVLVATGLAQLGNVGSSSPSGGGGGGGVPSVQSQGRQQFIEDTDTTNLDLSSATEGGSNRTMITFDTDTGDSLFDAFAEAMNKGLQQGRFG